jgi:hypothetical protein
MLIQNQQALSFLSVKQLVKPSEARAVPITLDYSVAGANGVFSLNLQNMQARDFIGTIQALWIDNAANASILFVNFPVANQTIQFPPNSQGYVNALCVNPAQINFTTAGTPIVQVSLLNYPVTDTVWGVSSGASISGVLSNAQVLTMFSAPTLVIPAPPSLTALIELINFRLENATTGVAYTSGGAIGLFYGPSIAGAAASSQPAATLLTVPVVPTIQGLNVATFPGAVPSSTCLGLGLYLGNLTANFATGTGTLKYTAFYRITSGW